VFTKVAQHKYYLSIVTALRLYLDK
jgi:hypothetical protein